MCLLRCHDCFRYRGLPAKSDFVTLKPSRVPTRRALAAFALLMDWATAQARCWINPLQQASYHNRFEVSDP